MNPAEVHRWCFCCVALFNVYIFNQQSQV